MLVWSWMISYVRGSCRLGYSWCAVSSDEQGEGTRSDSWFFSDSQVTHTSRFNLWVALMCWSRLAMKLLMMVVWFSKVSRVLDGVWFLWLVITHGLWSGLCFGRSSPTFSGSWARFRVRVFFRLFTFDNSNVCVKVSSIAHLFIFYLFWAEIHA